MCDTNYNSTNNLEHGTRIMQALIALAAESMICSSKLPTYNSVPPENEPIVLELYRPSLVS